MTVRLQLVDNAGSRKERFAKDKLTIRELNDFIEFCDIPFAECGDFLLLSPFSGPVCFGGVLEKSWLKAFMPLTTDKPIILLIHDPAYNATDYLSIANKLIERGLLSLTDSQLENLGNIYTNRLVAIIAPGDKPFIMHGKQTIAYPLAWSYNVQGLKFARYNEYAKYDLLYLGRKRAEKRPLLKELYEQSSLYMASVGGYMVTAKARKRSNFTELKPCKYSEVGSLLSNAKTSPFVMDEGHKPFLPNNSRKVELLEHGVLPICASSWQEYDRIVLNADLKELYQLAKHEVLGYYNLHKDWRFTEAMLNGNY